MKSNYNHPTKANACNTCYYYKEFELFGRIYLHCRRSNNKRKVNIKVCKHYCYDKKISIKYTS